MPSDALPEHSDFFIFMSFIAWAFYKKYQTEYHNTLLEGSSTLFTRMSIWIITSECEHRQCITRIQVMSNYIRTDLALWCLGTYRDENIIDKQKLTSSCQVVNSITVTLQNKTDIYSQTLCVLRQFSKNNRIVSGYNKSSWTIWLTTFLVDHC